METTKYHGELVTTSTTTRLALAALIACGLFVSGGLVIHSDPTSVAMPSKTLPASTAPPTNVLYAPIEPASHPLPSRPQTKAQSKAARAMRQFIGNWGERDNIFATRFSDTTAVLVTVPTRLSMRTRILAAKVSTRFDVDVVVVESTATREAQDAAFEAAAPFRPEGDSISGSLSDDGTVIEIVVDGPISSDALAAARVAVQKAAPLSRVEVTNDPSGRFMVFPA